MNLLSRKKEATEEKISENTSKVSGAVEAFSQASTEEKKQVQEPSKNVQSSNKTAQQPAKVIDAKIITEYKNDGR